MGPNRARADGFSLAELLVVVLILGVLVTIATPVYLRAAETAERTSCQANQRIIYSAVMSFRAFRDDEVPRGCADEALTRESAWGMLLIPKCIESAPRCPSNGGLYVLDDEGGVVSDGPLSGLLWVGGGSGQSHRLER